MARDQQKRNYGSNAQRRAGQYGRDYDDSYAGGYGSRYNAGNDRRTGNADMDPYSEYYHMSSEDYDDDMRYGRSGIERIERPYNPPKRRAYTGSDYGPGSYGSSSEYDQDDYDSNYGNSLNYTDRTFGGHMRRKRFSG